eukprot:COSAG04_NODE_10257_length_792_cov_0.989899_1_plen_57_part_10
MAVCFGVQWTGYVEGKPEVVGQFPSNYVHPLAKVGSHSFFHSHSCSSLFQLFGKKFA